MPVPTSAVAVGPATNGGALFHLTALCSHAAVMRCSPCVSAGLLGLLPANSSAVAELTVDPNGMAARGNCTSPRQTCVFGGDACTRMRWLVGFAPAMRFGAFLRMKAS